MRKRPGDACLAIVVLLILPGGVSPLAIAQERPLQGQVIDARGIAVSDATIFLTQVGRPRYATDALARTRAASATVDGAGRMVRSAADGSFSALLPVGRYLIAAFKPGYEVALSEVVHLQARRLVEIRMTAADGAPAGPEEEAAARERDLDWILRHSGEDVLRDRRASLGSLIDAGGPGPDTSVPAACSMPTVTGRLPIDGEFRQDLGGTNLLGGEAPGPGGSSSRSTRLDLRGGAGDRGSWWFDGATDRTLSALDGDQGVRRARRSSGLGLALDYRLLSGDALQARLRYGVSRYLLDAIGSGEAFDQDQNSAGAQARWERKLSLGALLYATGSYMEAGVRQRFPEQGQVPEVAPGDLERGAVDRSLGAAAGMAFKVDDHDVGVGMRLHTYQYDLGDGGALLSRLDPGGAPLEDGGRGSAMSLFGRDDWRLAEGYVLNYGLGYHSGLSTGGAWVVPRVGVTRAMPGSGDLLLRSTVMYRVDDGRVPWTRGERSGEARVDAARLGYEIAVEHRPEDRLQFTATVSYVPFQNVAGEEAPLAAPGIPDRGLLVLSDAGAGRHEMEIELQRGFGFVRGSVAGVIGRVEGRLSPAVDEAPLQSLRSGEARYYSTTLRALFEPTDTELRIDYRKIMGETESDAAGGAGLVAYRRLDLAVLQDLPWVAVARARWRVLMAYQGLLYASLDGPAVPGSGVTSRLTGGVDVSF